MFHTVVQRDFQEAEKRLYSFCR